MITANLHDPRKAEAVAVDGASWLKISSDTGTFTIFMPYPAAVAMVAAWEASQKEAAE